MPVRTPYINNETYYHLLFIAKQIPLTFKAPDIPVSKPTLLLEERKSNSKMVYTTMDPSLI
jgi:hypothetical protein